MKKRHNKSIVNVKGQSDLRTAAQMVGKHEEAI